MAQGVTGYVDFSGDKGFTLRVHYSETYDTASNTSPSFTITKIQVYSAQYGNTYWHYLNGTISVDGKPVVTMDSGKATHEVYIKVGEWSDCSGILGGVSGISHNSDGSKNITIAVNVQGITLQGTVESGFGWKASGSRSVALTTIPKASEITSAGNVTLGNACNVKWTPKAAAFRYRLKFSLGNWSYTTGAIHPNTTAEYTYSGYTIPLEVAQQMPTATSGTMTVELYSYSDSGATAQIGSADSATFTVTIPESELVSKITSVANVTLGNKCSIKWTPKRSAFRFKLKFSIGNWSYTTGAIHPNTTGEYTYTGYVIPLEVAQQMHDATSSTMRVELYSYSDSGATRQIGNADAATFTVTIPDSLLVSEITRASNVILGNKCSVSWIPKRSAFRYKLRFRIGNWSYTTGTIHPNKTTEYTYSGYMIPLEVAEQIPNTTTGTMTVDLYTYSDTGATKQIGSVDSDTFTVTVPDNNDTRPAVTMALSPVSSLASKFAGLYIQGKTKVKATINAEGKLNATIKGSNIRVEGKPYAFGDGYTSDYLNTPGTVRVYGYATDSRGFVGSTNQDITVIGYAAPKILAASGESDVVAARCDSNGNLRDDGAYLKIKAKRSYSTVTSGGVQKNFCQIRFRYKLESAESYSDWTTILAGSNLSSDEIVTGALLGGVLSAGSTYVVQLQAVDDIGESATATLALLTEAVYMHRTKNAMGLGKYVEGENLLDVAWDTHLRGEVRIGAAGMTLREYILAVLSEGG